MKSFTHLKHHNTYSHMSKKCVCDHSLPPHFTNLTPPPLPPYYAMFIYKQTSAVQQFQGLQFC